MTIISTGKATSFIDFTRASNATVTDSDGVIKWAPHNLLTNSESFDAAAWTKTTLTVAANTDPAPNSTTTADTLTAGGANSTILQTYTAEAVSYTYGVYLRRKTGTGIIQIASDSGTWNTVTITSSWALYTIAQTPVAGSKTAGIRIVTSGDEVYAWGAALYRSDLGGMQPNTSAYPMYNPTTPKNLVGYTETFSNAYWTKNAASIVSGAMTAPNGLQTADKIVESATASFHAAYTGITAAANRTFSVYLKAGERTYAQIFDPGNGRFGLLVVDLSNGTIAQNSSSITVSISPQGNGWYRVSAQPIATCMFVGVATLNTSTASNAYGSSYTGDGTSGIYLWGAQLSDSASLDTYSPVYGAAVTSAAYYGPRRDFDPVTLACKGLLVEEQRTNLLTYSEQFDTWTKTVAGDVVTANATTAPSGSSTADLFVPDTTSDQHKILRSAGSSAANNTATVYAKAAGYNWIILQGSGFAWFNLSTGVVGTQTACVGSITAVGNGWYRCSITMTSATVAGVYVWCSNANGVTTFAGNGTSGVYLWGAQLEDGSFATSYIPTGAATATRNADVASVSTQAFPYSATEGALVASVDLIGYPNNVTNSILTVGSSSANYFGLSAYSSTGLQANTSLRYSSRVSGTFDADASVFSAPNLNTAYKIAGAFKQDDFAACVNGGTVGTDALGNLPSGLTQMGIGQTVSANYLNGHIRQITYLPRRISNTELQTRTA